MEICRILYMLLYTKDFYGGRIKVRLPSVHFRSSPGYDSLRKHIALKFRVFASGTRKP